MPEDDAVVLMDPFHDASVIEAMARALWQADDDYERGWRFEYPSQREEYETMARAALAAYRAEHVAL